jgi:trimeric autotransporter adhesin
VKSVIGLTALRWGRSILFQNGLNVGLGTTAPLAKFQVSAATPLVTIKGLNTATTGATYGVLGQANSVSGTGVYGKAIATTGAAIGVRGSSASPNGYAGLFTNSAQGIAIKASDGTPVSSSPLRPVIQATSRGGVTILGWSTDLNAGVGVAGVVNCGTYCQDQIRSGGYGMYAYTSQSYTTALLTESSGRALEARAFGDNEGVVATSNNSVGSTIYANNGFNGAFALLAGTDALTDNAYGLRAGGSAGRCNA